MVSRHGPRLALSEGPSAKSSQRVEETVRRGEDEKGWQNRLLLKDQAQGLVWLKRLERSDSSCDLMEVQTCCGEKTGPECQR